MTLSKKLAIVFVVLGELFLLGGLIVCYTQWPNIFQGLAIGPGLIVVGVAVEILGLKNLGSISKNS